MATVFVLEDDADLRNLYSRALRFQGYEVESADSAESAIALFDEGVHTPDVAVLDMSMPGLPGSAVVHYIRAESNFQDMPIIVISCDEDFRAELQSVDVTFLTKPIDLSDLYQAIARFAT